MEDGLKRLLERMDALPPDDSEAAHLTADGLLVELVELLADRLQQEELLETEANDDIGILLEQYQKLGKQYA